MPIHDIFFIALFTGAFCLLAGALAWADWQESRAKKRKAEGQAAK